MRDRGRAPRLIAAALACALPARAEPPAPAPEPAPQDVTIRATRARDPGARSMTAGEVREMPGAFGDAFRAVDALPGVTPIVSGLPFFFVRGAPPGNVGTFVDGVRVPLLYHLGAGPSVVHPGLLERVDFYPGGYPARFGRFAGAILSGDLVAPKDRFHGEANVRLFDAGALAEAPFDDGKGHALVGGRFGYPALVLPIFAPDTRLAYWDYQTRETFALSDVDTVSVFAFGSYDDMQQRDRRTAPFHELLGMQFHRVDLRYDRALPNGGRARVAATFGWEASNDDKSGVSDGMTGVRAEIAAPIDRRTVVRGGADMTFDHYSLRQSVLDDAALLYPPRDDVALGVWTDVVWRPAPRVEIVPGLRGDVFNSHRLDRPPIRIDVGFDPGNTGLNHTVTESAIPAIDPRLAVRVGLTRRVTYVSTFGVAHQRPSFFVPIPGLQISELKPSLQSSVQTSQGLEVALPADVTASVTGFAHEYFGMTDITQTCPGNRGDSVRSLCIDDRVRGRAYGMEIFVRRALTKRVTGWLSYTLSRTERQAHDPGALGSRATSWVPSEFDRTHVLSAVGACDLGRGWRAGARFYFDTGRPYSQTALGVALPPYDSLRLPSFWRLDLRLEKQWRVGETTRVALVVEGLNVTLNKEAVSVQCVSSRASPIDTCKPEYVGPVTVPSVGGEIYW